jgi:oligoribonuclease
MDEWCTEHHGASGLTQRVRDSTIDMQAAEAAVLSFVKSHVEVKGIALQAGNSIHTDRVFLNKFMPNLLQYLHYRIVDVSSIGECARRWNLPVCP